MSVRRFRAGVTTVALTTTVLFGLPPAAHAAGEDFEVGLSATASLLTSSINYEQSTTYHIPGGSIGAYVEVTTTLPPQTISVSNLDQGCTYDGTARTVVCGYAGSLIDGVTHSRTFTANLSLVSIGPLPASATLTSSTAGDANSANNTATANCTAITGLVITC